MTGRSIARRRWLPSTGLHRAEPVPADREPRPTLDPAQLQSLLDLLPAQSVRDFVEMYLRHADDCMAQLEEMANREDLAGLAREAHTSIGTAGNVGAAEVTELARALEAVCRSGDRDAAAVLAPRMIEASKAASAALRAWLDHSANAPGLGGNEAVA